MFGRARARARARGETALLCQIASKNGRIAATFSPFFTPPGVPLRRTRPHAAATLAARLLLTVLLVALVAPAVVRAQTLSPGPLSQVHAALDRPDACGKCHVGGSEVGTERCFACHAVTGRAYRAKRGLHYQLAKKSGRACGACHREHHGRRFRLVRFEAQVPDFDHANTGFELDGRHESLRCDQCHRGKLRYQGLSQRCVSCHADRHGGQLGTRCASCHTTAGFRPAPRFDHDRAAFRLQGRHRSTACDRCHPARGEAGDRRWKGVAHDACTRCHQDPHVGAMGPSCTDCHTTAGWERTAVDAPWDHAAGRFPLDGGHRRVSCDACHGARRARRVDGRCASCHRDPHAGRVGRDCERCHSIEGWPRIADAAASDHAAGRFSLVGAHARAKCDACHGASMERKVEARCASCHAEPHAGRLGDRCQRCHDARSWALRPGAAFDHDATRFRLEGRHRHVGCRACHRKGTGYRQRFADVPHERCRTCHDDVHGRSFASVEAGDRCESCHSVSGFVPARYTRGEHARATFPLDGAHQAVPCAGCHPKGDDGRVQLDLPRRACGDCHADPHKGAFRERMSTKSCGNCHGTSSWGLADFDHGSTRFPLSGRHRDVACAVCHGAPEGGASPRYRGLDRRCGACHVDAHFGQFAEPAPARDCGDCHDTERFALPAFDHAARTGAALEGGHERVACARCHPDVPLPEGGRTRMYRPTEPACEGCHASPHGPLGGAKCSDCHSVSGWSAMPANVTFDHGRTGFPLQGRHREVGCRTCHGERRGPASGGRRACADCHDDVHRGREGPSCGGCHTTRSWRVPGALRAHDQTRFPLVGAHRTADCVACHAGQEPPEWGAAPRDCFACHAEDYSRSGNHPDHVAGGFPVRCEDCHRQFSWRGAPIRHEWWPLRGAHAATDCFRCHEGGRFAGTSSDCATCHQASWDATALPSHAAFGLSTRCADCHGEAAWAPTRGRWHEAAFPIERGAHRGLACADCHPTGSAIEAACTPCHAHTQGRMDAKHDDESGYVYESGACLACHPRGEE